MNNDWPPGGKDNPFAKETVYTDDEGITHRITEPTPTQKFAENFGKLIGIIIILGCSAAFLLLLFFVFAMLGYGVLLVFASFF